MMSTWRTGLRKSQREAPCVCVCACVCVYYLIMISFCFGISCSAAIASETLTHLCVSCESRGQRCVWVWVCVWVCVCKQLYNGQDKSTLWVKCIAALKQMILQ